MTNNSGFYGEQAARKWLESRGHTVIDRRANPDYWKKDIDFSVSKGKQHCNVEIKWDYRMQKSGCMFLELITDIQENKAGWAIYTEADYIFYGDAGKGIFYIFSVADMKHYLKNHIGEYSTRTATEPKWNTRQIKQSLGAIVPIEQFKKYYDVQEAVIWEEPAKKAAF